MSKLIISSLERAGIAQIVSGEVTCQVEVKRLTGRSSYTVLVDGLCKGISRATAGEAWAWVVEYFRVWTIETPEVKQKKKKK